MIMIILSSVKQIVHCVMMDSSKVRSCLSLMFKVTSYVFHMFIVYNVGCW